MKVSNVIAMLLISAILCSCNSEQLCNEHSVQDDAIAIENVKSDLMQLNDSYLPLSSNQKRMPKWLRWLIFGAADTAGAIFGGVGGACSASTLAWTVTKQEMSNTQNGTSSTAHIATPLKSNYLQGITPGSAGYIHNAVISSAFNMNNNICELRDEEIFSVVFCALEKETGNTLSNTEKSRIIDCTNTIINSFDVNKSVSEYIDDLILQTTNQQKKYALDVCKTVLDGLQYIDDTDTTYVKSVTETISNSNLSKELKKSIMDGISIADASAKLWNTSEIVSIPAK